MKKLMIGILLIMSSSIANAAEGVINVESQFSVDETANRLVNILNKKGMTLFNRVKHSKAAEKVGIEMRQTELVIFGNPKIGSLLMKCQQSIAIDLPLKALIWKGKDNKVWLSYNDINYLSQRHHLKNCEKVTAKVKGALKKIMHAASSL